MGATPVRNKTILECTRCGRSKPKDEFGIRKSSGTRYSWCAHCKRNYDAVAAAQKRAVLHAQS